MKDRLHNTGKNHRRNPRGKLIREGAGTLSDTEILAVFLGTGKAGKPVLDLAFDVLGQCGSIRGLVNQPVTDFCKIPGLGLARFCQLQAAVELARRHFRETLTRGKPLENPQATRRYLSACLRDRRREVFVALYLDNQHRIIGLEELFLGTIDGASVYPRVVAEKALRCDAAALIIAHNHPSGVAEPSAADQAITRRLRDALGLFDIRLLDHLIIGDGSITSFAERGLM